MSRYTHEGLVYTAAEVKELKDEIEKLRAEIERLKQQLDNSVFIDEFGHLDKEIKNLRAENARLQSIINRAYSHLGFTGAKNQTMKILGEGISHESKNRQALADLEKESEAMK